MNEQPLPEDLRQFIDACIDSAAMLDLLLLLYREPQREQTVEEIAANLCVVPTWTRSRLRTLVRLGLACETDSPRPCYRYYPASLNLNATVAALARTCRERPLAVTSYIHSQPSIARRVTSTFRR